MCYGRPTGVTRQGETEVTAAASEHKRRKCTATADGSTISSTNNWAEKVATAAEARIPGVVDAPIATAGATRGPSLLGAAPGDCCSPAKAELRMNALQRHKRALALTDLRNEFLSGAGCASFLLLEDSDIEELHKEVAGGCKRVRNVPAENATELGNSGASGFKPTQRQELHTS